MKRDPMAGCYGDETCILMGIWGYCDIMGFYKQQYVNVFEKYVVAVAE